MFCPVCGRQFVSAGGRAVPYPMFVCPSDGVVYDQKRSQWYGLPEIDSRLCCPGCGSAMEAEPKEPPVRIFVCYQCGTTYDKSRTSWYGLAYHHPAAPSG